MPDTTIKHIMKEKLGELISLNIDKIQISEFNTRCQFVDHEHVETLMKSIEENGYIPKSAVWVNAIKGPDGEIMTYRLVAGRHRYEATKRLGMKQIPSQLYYNLTDEEECELDDIDNKLDEAHKPINFLDVAEHYKYLRDVKGWSQRQIARAKNVSKTYVLYRLKIADLSKDVKELFRGGQHVDHFVERHIIEICKLKKRPHHILICKEIIASNLSLEEGHKKFPELKSIPSKPMTQKDIEARVQDLLEFEKEGNIAPEAQQFVDKSHVTETLTETDPTETIDPPSHPEQLEFELFSKISDSRIIKPKPKEFRFSILPLWIRHTDLINSMCGSAYLFLNELITYDFRYKPEKDKFFFIKHSRKYDKCEEFLAHLAGVKPKTLHKKVLLGIKDYVHHKKEGATIKFQMKWDKLYEVYKSQAQEIPFDDGGLLDIPEDFTGWISPTPYHSIYIENGKVQNVDNALDELPQETREIPEDNQIESTASTSPDQATTKEYLSPIALQLKEIGMAEQQIFFCINKKDITADVLKYIEEMAPSEKDKIKNLPGYIYKLVKEGFTPPEGFESTKEVAEKKDRKKSVEEFGTMIEEKFRAGDITHFCPVPDKKYEISLIPNNTMFLYYKMPNKPPVAGTFSEFSDEKYFC